MEIITKTKAKKQGNSISVTLPVQIDVKAGTGYILYKKENGTLLLIPELDDIFGTVSDGAYSQPLEWGNFEAQGKEMI